MLLHAESFDEQSLPDRYTSDALGSAQYRSVPQRWQWRG